MCTRTERTSCDEPSKAPQNTGRSLKPTVPPSSDLLSRWQSIGVDIIGAQMPSRSGQEFILHPPLKNSKAVELNLIGAVPSGQGGNSKRGAARMHKLSGSSRITSISVERPIAKYGASRFMRAAVVGLVKSLSNEFGKDGILVNKTSRRVIRD